MHTWFVQPFVEKPDFRLVVSFLWGDSDDVDTDGDANNPASRAWTWLYVKNRRAPFELVEIDEDDAGSIRVHSDTASVAAAVGFFLAKEGNVRVSRDGVEWTHCDLLRRDAAGFDLEAGLARAARSVSRRATPSHPYPNRE